MGNETMHKTTKIIKGTKVVDTSVGSITDVEDMEFEIDSMGIETTDHVVPSNVSHVTMKDTDMQTIHTRTGLISNSVPTLG